MPYEQKDPRAETAAKYRAELVQKLDDIRIAHGAVHENKARQVFAEALLYLIGRTK